MRLAEIHRYPVKSMQGERLMNAALGTLGLPGDRAWALRDETAGGHESTLEICLSAVRASPHSGRQHAPRAKIVRAQFCERRRRSARKIEPVRAKRRAGRDQRRDGEDSEDRSSAAQCPDGERRHICCSRP